MYAPRYSRLLSRLRHLTPLFRHCEQREAIQCNSAPASGLPRDLWSLAMTIEGANSSLALPAMTTFSRPANIVIQIAPLRIHSLDQGKFFRS